MLKKPTIKLAGLVFFAGFLSIFVSEANARSASPHFVKGIVCEDRNSNSLCDADEPGIAGVMVSNQREVALTDKNGYYQLPVEEEMIVFITKPAGYDLPLDENNLPRFYYIHYPDGSPTLEFSGLEPTGPLPESVDFGLIPSEKKDSFTAVVLADPTLREQAIPYYRDGVISELSDVKADFAMVLGDIMADNLSFYDRYNGIMKTLDMPVFNIVGNHDVNFTDLGNRYAKETYKKYFGPSYFSFEYGDVHFVALDNIDYLGHENGGSYYRGYLNETILTWIRNNLQYVDKDKMLVFLAHIPLYSMDTDARSNNTVNRTELLELLEDRDRVLFLCGHRHMVFHHFLDEEFGRMNKNPIHHISVAAAAGGWWRGPKTNYNIPVSTQNDGTPNGYHIFHFDGNTYRERYKAAGLDPGYQMRIEAPDNILAKEDIRGEKLIVNVFNGNKNSDVRFRIHGDNEWYNMERQESYKSPFLIKAEWINPMDTNHIWLSELPDLEKGVHKITVRTRDMYGQEFEQTKLIEVE